MGRRHRPSKADRQAVTRRYVARVVWRARQDIIAAVVASGTTACPLEPDLDARYRQPVPPVPASRLHDVLDYTFGKNRNGRVDG